MDGNGRWAQGRQHSRTFGHVRGVQTAKTVIKAAKDEGVPFVTLFTFSTENWQRPGPEVEVLMKLIARFFAKERVFLGEHGVRVQVIGNFDRVSDTIKKLITDVTHETKNNTGIQVTLAFSYSGRQELLDAVNRIIKSKIDQVTERNFEDYFYCPGLPHPDLLIRTGNEFRLSNFFLWQAAYCELYFSTKLWPDFTPEDLRVALNWFSGRTRRFGKI